MRVYTRDLIRASPSPTENIILLERLRRKYGEVKSDGLNGSYFDLPDDEDVFGLRAGAFYGSLHAQDEQP